MSSQDEQLYIKLHDWFKELDATVLDLHTRRKIFRDVQEILLSNERVFNNHFTYYLNDWYGMATAISIRALVDKDKNTRSYSRFLTCMKMNPNCIVRSRFLEKWQNKETGNEVFNEFASANSYNLDAALIKSDLEELNEKTKIVRDYTDKAIAHLDKRGAPIIPKWTDFDEAIDCIGKLHQKYFRLLDGGTTTLSTSIGYDWKELFRFAWLPDKEPEIW
ncbi:MAG: hypothetical protein KA746_07730 [Pyrinomonadaceae bacterium]|nr:hypothetical protein [Pyrinomonadaceae bacterium]